MEQSDRIERLLVALLLQSMKGDSLGGKVKVLSEAGFSPIEIANLLGIRAHNVSQHLYLHAKSKSKKVVKK